MQKGYLLITPQEKIYKAQIIPKCSLNLKIAKYKSVKVGKSMSILLILDNEEEEILEEFKIPFINFENLKSDLLYNPKNKKEENILDQVIANRLFSIFLNKKPELPFFKDFGAFKKFCQFLNCEELTKILTLNSKLYRRYWEDNQFWYGLYQTNFHFTGFEVKDLNWRIVYLKKLKDVSAQF